MRNDRLLVPASRLRSFAAERRETAQAVAGLQAARREVTTDLPGTRTAEAVATAGADLEAAIGVLARRMREMADVADGAQDNDDATKNEIAEGFTRTSR